MLSSSSHLRDRLRSTTSLLPLLNDRRRNHHNARVSDIAAARLPKLPSLPQFANKFVERRYLKDRLAAAFRLFSQRGYDEGVAGHITLRDPVDIETFWLNPFGVPFGQITSRHLIRVNHAGIAVGGDRNALINTAAFAIHSAIHKVRPSVNVACHAHTLWGRSFCTLGKPLSMITQDSCAFHEDHVVHPSFNGIVLAQDEGRAIAANLGLRKAALLQNHGLLTVGETLESAVWWFVALDRCCQSQLLAESAGTPIEINPEAARGVAKDIGNETFGYFSGRSLLGFEDSVSRFGFSSIVRREIASHASSSSS